MAARGALGFGGLLVVPLVVHARVLGAITFITREDDPPFSTEEVALASDLADLCALALDNERLYRQARELRERPTSRTARSRPSSEDEPRVDDAPQRHRRLCRSARDGAARAGEP